MCQILMYSLFPGNDHKKWERLLHLCIVVHIDTPLVKKKKRERIGGEGSGSNVASFNTTDKV